MTEIAVKGRRTLSLRGTDTLADIEKKKRTGGTSLSRLITGKKKINDRRVRTESQKDLGGPTIVFRHRKKGAEDVYLSQA